MLSVFIMYSTDRADALAYTLACLRDMPLYDRCQRTLVVDGKIDAVPPDWEAVQVPRLGGKFCWARMWDAGVYSAAHETVVYLDSDRLLPPAFLEAAAGVGDDAFAFPARHFLMLDPVPLPVCRRLLREPEPERAMLDPDCVGRFRFEARAAAPVHGPGKNVMSGSVAFTRRTYRRLGGVDPWYCGHGAFADTDFHMRAAVGGCRFVDLGLPELHYPHPKLDAGAPLGAPALHRLGLDNFVYYCHKWGLPAALAEGLAVRCGVPHPARYVTARLRELRAAATGS